MERPRPPAVPAAPNEGLVQGRILEVTPLPEGCGTAWSLRLAATTDLPGTRNFARRPAGSILTILVHPDLEGDFRPGEDVEARVSYQGDERGGDFFLMGQDVRKLGRRSPGGPDRG